MNKKEKFSKWLERFRPDVVIVGEYINKDLKTDIYFSKCGHTPKMAPNSIKNRQNCAICRGMQVCLETSIVTTHSDIAKEWNLQLNGCGPETVSRGSHKIVWWTCSTCSTNYQMPIKRRTLSGVGCQLCRKDPRVVTEENSLGCKFPHLVDEWAHDLNGNLTPFNVPAGSRLNVWWNYKCGHIGQQIIAYRSYSENGCIECNATPRKTHEEYVEEIKEIRGNDVEVVGEYSGRRIAIRHKWTECEHITDITPSDVLRGRGCGTCGVRQLKSHDQYVSDVEKVHEGRISVEGIYVGSKGKVAHRCSACGVIWSATPTNVVNNGSGCPNCLRSKGEEIIAKILTAYEVKFEKQKKFDSCKDKRHLPFDFYINSHNTCIEFDGLQHYEPWAMSDEIEAYRKFLNIKLHDFIKDKFCEESKINLIRIPYTDIANIEKILTKELQL